jgi:hypothetical protein
MVVVSLKRKMAFVDGRWRWASGKVVLGGIGWCWIALGGVG